MDNFYVIEANPKDWIEAIETTAAVLKENGCVLDDFVDKCIEREKEYPTGLPTFIPVAIPHTDAESVCKAGACLMRLEEPVAFHNMERIDEYIDVKFVLNLAILEGREQLKTLTLVIQLFQDKEFLDQSENLPIDELKELFLRKWDELDVD